MLKNTCKKYYVGIDPGSKGAIAFLNYDGSFNSVVDMPTVDQFMDELKHSNRWDNEGDFTVAIESVHPLPGQSCMASFSYGGNFLLARAIGFWYNSSPVLVTPQKWKSFYDLRRGKEESKTQYKHRSVEKARMLYPQADLPISKDGRAEALLIARYQFSIDNLQGETNE